MASRCGSKVLVDFSYIGTGYHGLAYQTDEPHTVEGHLFDALSRAKMAVNVLNNGYERCGRTDKDVHALHNYCSFYLDSCSPEEHCSTEDGKRSPICYRINSFVKAVNKHLPKSIRVNTITAIPDDFSSRRSCTGRTYKYFFQLRNMDLAKMREACHLFVGKHNFLQFCKMDPRNPKDPNTTIYSFNVEPYNDLLCVATVSGNAFLWHQVRCMVGVLFLVGDGTIPANKITDLLERPEQPKFKLVVFLDAGFNTNSYKMASPHGLILSDCTYDVETGHRLNSVSSVYQAELENSIQRLGPLSLLAGDPSL